MGLPGMALLDSSDGSEDDLDAVSEHCLHWESGRRAALGFLSILCPPPCLPMVLVSSGHMLGVGTDTGHGESLEFS